MKHEGYLYTQTNEQQEKPEPKETMNESESDTRNKEPMKTRHMSRAST